MCDEYGCGEEGKGEEVGLMKGSLVFSHLERVYVVILLGARSKTPQFSALAHTADNP